MFHVGQKVVCVDPGSYPDLSRGATYTVSGFEETLGAVFVGLVEIERGRPSWYPRRFRPIVKRETSIAIFTEMLNPLKADA